MKTINIRKFLEKIKVDERYSVCHGMTPKEYREHFIAYAEDTAKYKPKSFSISETPGVTKITFEYHTPIDELSNNFDEETYNLWKQKL